MTTAIIPARGGSKGIKRKNLVNVCGKPLVLWTIEQALACMLIDEVIVSTDCREIGEVATAAGAKWFPRSDSTASDTATSESALLEVLESLDPIDLVVFLQATSPIRQPGDIEGAIQTLVEEQADSCFSARCIEGYTWTVGGAVTPNYYDRQRRQNQSVTRWEENGSIYVFKPAVLRENNKRLGGKIAIYEMHPLDSFQVDVPADLQLIEQLMALRLGVERLTSTAI